MDCGKVWAGPSDYTKPCEEQDGVRRGQAGARGALRRHGRSLPLSGISVVVSAEIAVGFRWGYGGVSVRMLRGEDATRRLCGDRVVAPDPGAVTEL
jgi:hypothetical protein